MAQVARFNPNSYGAKADEDMVTAVDTFNKRAGLPRSVIFWCEQAIEKYFKHILSYSKDPNKLSLRHKLLPLAKEVGFVPTERERYLLGELSRMYYERYPTEDGEELPEDPDWDDVQRALELAVRVQEWTYNYTDRRSRQTTRKIQKMNLF